MKIIIGFFIFCLVLFIYLHVQFHLKTSNDLEMYEVDQCSKEKLEEICDLRQPALFEFENANKIMESTNQEFIKTNYHSFEIKIRNTKEDDSNSEMFIPLPLHAGIKLFEEDKNSEYLSENNSDFLQETGVVKNMSYQDELMRPYMVSNCNYDILMGSLNSCTPFRYEINYRNFFLLTQGSAQVKLAPPQSTRYLYPIYDYDNFEFRTPVNPWSPQPKYSAEFDKIKCLEFTLTPGKTLYIPAYWWYSIRLNLSNTCISCFRYRTYMNNIAITPYIFMHALQIQNVKRNTTKTVTIDETKNKKIVYDNSDNQNNGNNGNNGNTINRLNNIIVENKTVIDENTSTEISNLVEPASSTLLNDMTIGSEIV